MRLSFSSDATDYAAGFNLTYKALKPSYLPGKTTGFLPHCAGRLEKSEARTHWERGLWARGEAPAGAPSTVLLTRVYRSGAGRAE